LVDDVTLDGFITILLLLLLLLMLDDLLSDEAYRFEIGPLPRLLLIQLGMGPSLVICF